MFRLGGILMVLGILSFVLNHFGREFIVLMWIDMWGPKIGTAIRIGLIILGFILMGIGYSEIAGVQEEDAEPEA